MFCQIKCHRYWPSDGGSRLYGVILVELVEEESYSDYITRKFKLTHTEVSITKRKTSKGKKVINR